MGPPGGVNSTPGTYLNSTLGFALILAFPDVRPSLDHGFSRGEAFLLTVGAFLLTAKLLCLQSLKALIRRTFPL